jgi:hypothetical protein
MSDPFSRALSDLHAGALRSPVYYRDGGTREAVDLEGYFDVVEVDPDGPLASWLEGPLLDVGAGVGRHALSFQEQFETVAIDRRGALVEVMEDRGVEDARVADMFALPEAFERDRFRSAMAVGTQAGLAGTIDGLREFLSDLAYVTTPGATAVIDGFDPTHERTRTKLDFRADPAPGLAYRLLQVEYDGEVGRPWLYRLFTPERVREATAGTAWGVAAVEYGEAGEWDHVYTLAVEKRH